MKIICQPPLAFIFVWAYKCAMASNADYNDRLRREALPRAKQVRSLRQSGKTWTAIGLQLGISRQRAQQLGKRVGVK